jgi:hypothetical protein
MIRTTIRTVLFWMLVATVPLGLAIGILFAPLWLPASGGLLSNQLPALLVVGGLSAALFKLLQGFYYAKLDLRLSATLSRAPASPLRGLLWIRLEAQNVGVANVGIVSADLAVNGSQMADMKDLAFAPVACPNWLTRLWWGTDRDYILVCGTTEHREVIVEVDLQPAYHVQAVLRVSRMLSIFPGTWRASVAVCSTPFSRTAPEPAVSSVPPSTKAAAGSDLP